ncbi:hypothetical protein FSP39_017213 [Pinctada imbricata]|uniref:Potassium channel domain-containing protein n=1 Tax=Pinctada imbricata TaxID=66713 RepID=A0AA89BV32_PINIB|nr:hypothetical protein FSP39_017213 [Pinctada imbricata]
MSSDADLEAPVASVSDLHDDTLLGKARIYLAKIYRALKSLVGLAILLVLYSILGMAVFRMIEYPNEVEQRAKALEKKAEILQSMLNKTWMFNRIGETQWVEDTRALLASFEDIVRNMDYSSDTDENTWGWWSAFFYCTTIYTTIGYGSITPKTDLGRFVTILYALIGIPLALMVLAEVGKRFTVGLKFLWKFVRRYYYTGYCIKVRQQGKSYLDRGKTALRRASHRRRYRVNEDGKREEIPRTLYDKAPKDEKDEENPVANGHEPEDLEGSGSLCTLL